MACWGANAVLSGMNVPCPLLPSVALPSFKLWGQASQPGATLLIVFDPLDSLGSPSGSLSSLPTRRRLMLPDDVCCKNAGQNCHQGLLATHAILQAQQGPGGHPGQGQLQTLKEEALLGFRYLVGKGPGSAGGCCDVRKGFLVFISATPIQKDKESVNTGREGGRGKTKPIHLRPHCCGKVPSFLWLLSCRALGPHLGSILTSCLTPQSPVSHLQNRNSPNTRSLWGLSDIIHVTFVSLHLFHHLIRLGR